MKTILFVIVILSLCALAFGPSVTQPPQPPPQKTKPPTEPPPPPPPTEPPVITEPPGTEPPEITEPPGTEPPGTEPPSTEPPATEGVAPTERGRPHPETQETPNPGGEKPEPRVIKLPSSGYGPPAQPMSAETIARWGLLFLIGLAGIFIAGWSLKR